MRPHRWQPARLSHPWDSPGKNTGVGCHFLLHCTKVKSESEVAQLCLILSDPMDCSLPGSSVHGIFQARVLEWGAMGLNIIRTVLGTCSTFNIWQLLSQWSHRVSSHGEDNSFYCKKTSTSTDLSFIPWLIKCWMVLGKLAMTKYLPEECVHL